MSLLSPRSHRCFFSHKEAVAGTPDTNCFLEGQGTIIAKPSPELIQESNKGKLGSGEHGTKREIQAIWTPFSYTAQRFSEVAFLAAYALGGTYTIGGVAPTYTHDLTLLPVGTRILPTFTMEHGDGTTNDVYAHCIINELTLSISIAGTGVIECTVSGWMNGYSVTNGVFTKLSTGTMITPTYDIIGGLSEPLIKSRSMKLFKGTGIDSVTASTASYTSGNVAGTEVDLSTLFSTINMTINNGISVEELARGGGDGILNTQVRGERTLTLEIGIRKDIALIDMEALGLINTTFSLDLLYQGTIVPTDTARYAMKWLFPQVQIEAGYNEDDSSPIMQTWNLDVMQPSYSSVPLQWMVQSGVANEYNATFV